MNGNPTKAQKDFHNWIVQSTECQIDDTPYPELHHIVGSKRKLKGVKKFGEWYCIGLSFYWHRDGRNPDVRHPNKARFIRTIGKTEKELFLHLMQDYHSEFGRYPMTNEEFEIIKERA